MTRRVLCSSAVSVSFFHRCPVSAFDAIVDFLFSDHLHTQRAAHAALRALRSDEIACRKRRLLTGHTSVNVPVTEPFFWLKEVSSVLKRSAPRPRLASRN